MDLEPLKMNVNHLHNAKVQFSELYKAKGKNKPGHTPTTFISQFTQTSEVEQDQKVKKTLVERVESWLTSVITRTIISILLPTIMLIITLLSLPQTREATKKLVENLPLGSLLLSISKLFIGTE